ncbi:MAG: 3-demethylubiquinone-9 3-O-methyltransferase [Acidimicrobiales bacterium]|nr:3-demethylubiquinone-9 3-O-methyltransferase [Acidimicrobiales bacterium]
MSRATVDNDFYDALGSRWTDDPSHAIALLVAEAPAKLAYVRRAIGAVPRRIIDIGCGAGLLAVPLAADGHQVRAVDRSRPSLDVGRAAAERAGVPVSFDHQDALDLREPDGTFDAALLLDIIEHVEDPARLIAEAVRVVRPGGTVVFHTFTRNPVSYLVAVLGPRLITRDCPRHLHCYRNFVRPRELRRQCTDAGAVVTALEGFRPELSGALLRTAASRRVDPGFGFRCGGPVLAGYIGTATKAPSPGR